jgi:hypothetical protein
MLEVTVNFQEGGTSIQNESKVLQEVLNVGWPVETHFLDHEDFLVVVRYYSELH